MVRGVLAIVAVSRNALKTMNPAVLEQSRLWLQPSLQLLVAAFPIDAIWRDESDAAFAATGAGAALLIGA